MLRIFQSRRVLRTTTPGPLPRWVGHLLRGLIAARLKGRSCRYTPQEQQTTRRHCKGCPQMAGCALGETYEADPPAGLALAGQDDGVRPFALAPGFPAPPFARPGHALPVTAVFVGERAAAHASELWRAAASAGEFAGVGPGRVRFRVERGIEADSWSALSLPFGPDDLGLEVPAVRVELTTPLMLKHDGRPVTRPSFADLLRAGLRVLGALLRFQGEAGAIDFHGLKHAAGAVQLHRWRFPPFEQPHTSGRSGQTRPLRGVEGWGEYGPAPAALVRWLAAAGRVHAGQDRVAGAGGWRVLWRPNLEGPAHDWRLVD